MNDRQPEPSAKVALVAGATRGAGRAIAIELGKAGAHVYATGRSSRSAGRSEIDRPETIEETGELVEAAGGSATPLMVDHEDSGAVSALVERIEADHARLDVLVDDMFGGDRYAQWDKPLWEHDPRRWFADAPDGRRYTSDHGPSRAAADVENRVGREARTCRGDD